MKLRNKLLPIVATTSLVAAISPILASCNKGADVTVGKISDYAAIYGDEVSTTVYFTVSTEILSGQTLQLEAESQTLTITAAVNANNNRVIDVTATRKSTESVDDIDELIDLKFSCLDSNHNTIWSYTVEKYEFYYTPGATIPAEAKTATCEYDQTSGKSYANYAITLKEIPENASVKAELIISESYTGTITSSFAVTNGTGTLTVGWENGKLGETATFDVRLSCIDSTTQKQLISPLTIRDFKLTFNNGVKALSDACFIWDDAGTQITGFNYQLDTDWANKTTLVLPSKAKAEGVTNYTIADNAFYNTSSNEAGTKIPSNIVRLKIDNEACIAYGINCFKAAPFNCIDLTQKDSSSAFTNVTFSDNSFQFQSVTDLTEGSILWKNDSSKEYWTFKHEVKQKLWFEGGLANPQWFEYTAVSTEAELKAAAWHGGNIYLTADIEVNNIVSFENTSGIIDLAGFTISSKDGLALYNETNNEKGLLRFYNSSFMIMDSGKLVGTTRTFSGTIKPSMTRNSDQMGLGAIQVVTTSYASANCGLKIIGGNYYGNDTIVYNEGGYVEIKSATYGGNEYLSRFWLLENATLYPQSIVATKMMLYVGTYALGEARDHYYITSGMYYFTSYVSDPSKNQFHPKRGAEQSVDIASGDPRSWIPTGYIEGYICDPATGKNANKVYKPS